MPSSAHPLIVEFHLLQNFSPSCLNRDDTNTPKSSVFGGVRRARVSSQCLKRAIRLHMRDHYGIATGTRTRRLADVIADRLAKEGTEPRRDPGEALALARFALDQSGFKLTTGETEVRTQVGLYLAEGEIARLAAAVDADWGRLADARATAEAAARAAAGAEGARAARPRRRDRGAAPVDLPNVRQAIEAVRKTVDASDIALFGRMVAEHPHMKVDAASQVAHALSTHACELEMDYFTAVDDEQPDEDPGAGMLGLVGFQSACFYRYALVHRDQLVANLQGNARQANETIVAFLRASVEAIPTGRQNGSAAHNWPDHIAVRTGARLPLNLANAFEKPVRAGRSASLVQASAAALEAYRERLEGVYGADGDWFVCSTITQGNGSLAELETWLRRRLPEA
ncbi:MAG: type I-E CRISPR-associated protein Cas7/Cse4/CasC [Armatimonadetes bacterium]|nr:type I-E CRISPR-associated protein Cas7/Cse4/CasC [Armatimonadota bacterium]